MTHYKFEKIMINGVEIKPVPKHIGLDRITPWTMAEIKAHFRMNSPHRLPRRLRNRSW